MIESFCSSQLSTVLVLLKGRLRLIGLIALIKETIDLVDPEIGIALATTPELALASALALELFDIFKGSI